MAIWSPQTNNAQTTINQGGGIGAGDASVTITSATGFPTTNIHYHIIIDSEIIEVTAGQGTTTWTISRGQEGTSAAIHANAAPVTEILTAGALSNLFMTKIDENIVGVATATVSFPNLISSFPTAFRHLEIQYEARDSTGGNTGDAFTLRFNSDATANYGSGELYNSSSTVAAFFEQTAQTSARAGFSAGNGASANWYNSGKIWIPNWNSTTFIHQFLGNVNVDFGTGAGGTSSRQVAGWWNSTAAITSISLLCGAGNFTVGSAFTLYGLP